MKQTFDELCSFYIGETITPTPQAPKLVSTPNGNNEEEENTNAQQPSTQQPNAPQQPPQPTSTNQQGTDNEALLNLIQGYVGQPKDPKYTDLHNVLQKMLSQPTA